MCTSRLKETICAVLCGIDRGLIPSQHCIFSLKRLFLSIGWTGKQGKCSPERSKCCLNSEITTDRFAQLIRLLPDLCSVCTRTPESALAMTPNPPFLLLLVPERNKKTIKKNTVYNPLLVQSKTTQHHSHRASNRIAVNTFLAFIQCSPEGL